MMSADGSNKGQVTHNGAANWAPFLHPNNRQIIFSFKSATILSGGASPFT